MNIASICQRQVVHAPPDAPLSDVVALMQSRRVGTVVITRQRGQRQVVIGIITDRDIVRTQLARGGDLAQLSLAESMSTTPLLLNADADAAEALQRLRQRNVRRAPVVDRHGALVGVISVDDILAHLASQLTDLAAAVAAPAGGAAPAGERSRVPAGAQRS